MEPDRVPFDIEHARKPTCACGNPWCYIEKGKEPARVLFLDFDGVLNSSIGWKRDDPPSSTYVTAECVEQLSRILGECPDVAVCISSTWRRFYPVSWLGGFLGDREVPSHRIVSRTPMRMSSQVRGHEIQEWLDDHPFVQRFVIVDDDGDMAHLMSKLVQTDFTDGLTKEKAGEIIRRFG